MTYPTTTLKEHISTLTYSINTSNLDVGPKVVALSAVTSAQNDSANAQNTFL